MQQSSYTITEKQQQRLEQWQAQHTSKQFTGAIGGRYTFSFTPTNKGTITKVKEIVSGEECDLTDYEAWQKSA